MHGLFDGTRFYTASMKKLLHLVNLLDYPGANFDELLAQANALAPIFVHTIQELSPEDREELFSATFDINPSCVLYAGVHLFGEENFKRGELMAGLFARYQETGFISNGDLPDHISNLLRYWMVTDDAEQKELAEFCILGPLEKIISSLDPANPYCSLFEALQSTLQEMLPGVKAAPLPLAQAQTSPCVSAGCQSCAPISELTLA